MDTLNTATNSICLVVPCFNEEIRFRLEYWTDILKIPGIHLVFVDDGSQDKTSKVFSQLNNHKNCEIMTLDRNFGKANAIRLGMKHILESNNGGKYDALGFLDADGAFNPSEIARFFTLLTSEALSPYASVWSSRVQLSGRSISRKSYRHYIGRLVSSMISFKRIYIAYDTQSGFKIFKNSEDLKYAFYEPFRTRWFFDIELFARLSKNHVNYKIYEEPLNYWVDIDGSKIDRKQWLSILWDILKVRRILKKF